MLDVLTQYRAAIDVSITQLATSKEAVIKFQQILAAIITQLKKLGDEAKTRLNIGVKEIIDIINKQEENKTNLTQLQNNPDGNADAINNLEKAIKEAEDYKKSGFEHEYLAKQTYLEKYLTSNYRIMDRIIVNFNIDRNNLMNIHETVKGKLFKLKQKANSNILHTNMSTLSAKSKLITGLQSNIDVLNVSIAAYNALIDKINGTTEALKNMFLTSVSPKSKNIMLNINITEYVATLNKYSNFSFKLDPIKTVIEEYFEKFKPDKVDVVDIAVPDLTFKTLYEVIKQEDGEQGTFTVPEGYVPTPMETDDTNDDRLHNEAYQIKLRKEDFDSPVITDIKVWRYAELCSKISNKPLKMNDKTQVNVNFYINAICTNDVKIVIYKSNFNQLIVFKEKDKPIPNYLKTVFDVFTNLDIYIYNKFNNEEMLNVLHLLAIHATQGYNRFELLADTYEIWKRSISRQVLEAFSNMSGIERQDITVVFDTNIHGPNRKKYLKYF